MVDVDVEEMKRESMRDVDVDIEMSGPGNDNFAARNDVPQQQEQQDASTTDRASAIASTTPATHASASERDERAHRNGGGVRVGVGWDGNTDTSSSEGSRTHGGSRGHGSRLYV